jgi:hypothetical protein
MTLAGPSSKDPRSHQEIVTNLASAADELAQDAFAGLPWSQFRGSVGVALVVELASYLAEKDVLSKRTQAGRLRTLLSGLRLGPTELQGLAVAAREFPAHLRLTAAEFLPLSIRPQLYIDPDSTSARTSVVAGSNSAGTTSVLESVLGPQPAESVGEEIHTRLISEDFEDTEPVPECSTVFLLSHRTQQVENSRLLRDASLDPVVIESLTELHQQLLINKEVSACVVDQSFLENLGDGDQRVLFQELAGYSSFIRLRVQDTHLRLGVEEIRGIIKQCRGLGGEVPHSALSLRSESLMRPAEIEDLKVAGALLRSHLSAAFVLGELSSAEERLLVGAVRARAQAERPDGPVEISRLTMQFLHGGRSGARIATVRINDGRRIYVAKITNKPFAIDEVVRFRWFVQDWNAALQPEAYFHGDDAVILSSLVPNDADDSSPAPMLEERLGDLWNRQWMQRTPSGELLRQSDALGRGLQRAARDIGRLNGSTPRTTDFPSYVNPRTTHLEALDAARFDWGLAPALITARDIAVSRYRRLEHAAVVHGDVHLRNMLVRGDGEIHLIDYASSGPGHPALDLAQFELALYLGPVRQFESEARCVDFQRAVSISRASLEVLEGEFPTFFQCHVNRTCAQGIVAARDAAISAVQTHGGNAVDYISAKYLVAWQHLGLIGSHTGLARAVIEALASEINAL